MVWKAAVHVLALVLLPTVAWATDDETKAIEELEREVRELEGERTVSGGVSVLDNPVVVVTTGAPRLPVEAYTSCQGRIEGDSCSVTLRTSGVIEGTCAHEEDNNPYAEYEEDDALYERERLTSLVCLPGESDPQPQGRWP